ncbi:MAG: hypothetical protein PUE15_10715 [Prevotella sp.]|nr:hypothetical protein [Prevotella sp.]
MPKKYKPDIRVTPVTFSNGQPTKYQAFGQIPNGDVRIIGNPCPNRTLALRSLKAQCRAFSECAARVLEYIETSCTDDEKQQK